MAVLISDIISTLERWAPPGLQESYDNAGLIVGNPSWEIRGILCCLDSTEAVIEEAIESGCNLVVAHHPILFGGIKSLTGKNYVERTLLRAIKADIAIYAIHTNLDNVRTGVNEKIADKLGLLNREILAPKSDLLQKLVTFVPKANADQVRDAVFKAGAGVISDYDRCSFNLEGTGTFRGAEHTNPHVGKPGKDQQEPEIRIEVILPKAINSSVIRALKQAHPYEEVAYDLYPLANKHPKVGAGMVGNLPQPLSEEEALKMIKARLRTEIIRHTSFTGRKVNRIAVCGGSGSFLLDNAKNAGAQMFITGDYKYHQFFDADGELVIADIGHYESEQFTIELLSEYLTEQLKGPHFAEKFDNFAVRLTRISTNPVNYF